MKIWGAPLGVVISFGSLIFASCSKSQDGGLKGSGVPAVAEAEWSKEKQWRQVELVRPFSNLILRILSKGGRERIESDHKGLIAERTDSSGQSDARYRVTSSGQTRSSVYVLRTITSAAAYIKGQELLVDLRMGGGQFTSDEVQSVHGCPDEFELELPGGSPIALKRVVRLQGRGLEACGRNVELSLRAGLSSTQVADFENAVADQIKFQWVEKIGPTVPFARLEFRNPSVDRERSNSDMQDIAAALREPLGAVDTNRALSLLRAATVRYSSLTHIEIERMSSFAIPVGTRQAVPVSFQRGEEIQLVSSIAGRRADFRLKTEIVVGQKYQIQVRSAARFSQEFANPEPFADLTMSCLKQTLFCKQVSLTCGEQTVIGTAQSTPWLFVYDRILNKSEFIGGDAYSVAACTQDRVVEALRFAINGDSINVLGDPHLDSRSCGGCHISCVKPFGSSESGLKDAPMFHCATFKEDTTFGVRYSQPGYRSWKTGEIDRSEILERLVVVAVNSATGASCKIRTTQESGASVSFIVDEKDACIRALGLSDGQHADISLSNQIVEEVEEACGTVTNIVTRVGALPEQRTTVAQCLTPAGELLSRSSSAEGREVGPFKISMKNATRIELTISDQGVYL